MTESYPLHWPAGQPRTPPSKQSDAPFKVSQEQAQNELLREVALLGGTNLVISTNIPIRKDGLPYADIARRKITDSGVAVYFDLKGEQKCFACDRWWTIRDNIRAISKTIEALRGIERWGSGAMVDQAFRGFSALPPPGGHAKRQWHQVLAVDPSEPIEVCEAAFRAKARRAHPDFGGSDQLMAELNIAIGEARNIKGVQ